MTMKKVKVEFSNLPFGLPPDFDFTAIRTPADALRLIGTLPNRDRGEAALGVWNVRATVGNKVAYRALMVTIDIINREWLGGGAIAIPPDEVLTEFFRCERVLGSDWIDRARRGTPGTMPTLNVVAMGQGLAYIENLPNNGTLIEQLRKSEVAAHAELRAIYVLSKAMRPAIELYPT
jgi:hypothetical protein